MQRTLFYTSRLKKIHVYGYLIYAFVSVNANVELKKYKINKSGYLF